MMVLPTVFFVCVFFLPDTPPSLMSRSKPDAAYKSLLFYRTQTQTEVVSDKFSEEFKMLKQVSESKDYDEVELSDFCEFLCHLLVYWF